MQGIAPYGVLYATGPDGQKFSDGPTDWVTAMPSVTNADTLGVRPDLTGRPITSWADLISSDFKGKAALQDNPTIGVIALKTTGDRFKRRGAHDSSTRGNPACGVNGRSAAMKRPRPGVDLTSPSSQTISPREIVVTGQPRTVMPSYGVWSVA